VATRDKQHRTHPSSVDRQGQVIDFLRHHKARQIKNKQIGKSVAQSQSAATEDPPAALIPNGRLIVERFNDGTRKIRITGNYLHEPETATFDAIELTAFASGLWRKQKRQTWSNN